ncbi:MAG: helix-turn-helix domain-containing protein [Polyangiales bacterium]
MILHDPTAAGATRTPPPPADARRVVVITQDVARRSGWVDALVRAGLRVEVAAADARTLRADPTPDAAFVDLALHDALEVIRGLRRRDPSLKIVALADQAPDLALTQNLLRAGARDVLLSESGEAEVLEAAHRALARGDGASPGPHRCVCGAAGVLSMEALERRALEGAIEACGGNLTEVARRLRIGRTTLYRRLHHFEIRVR